MQNAGNATLERNCLRVPESGTLSLVSLLCKHKSMLIARMAARDTKPKSCSCAKGMRNLGNHSLLTCTCVTKSKAVTKAANTHVCLLVTGNASHCGTELLGATTCILAQAAQLPLLPHAASARLPFPLPLRSSTPLPSSSLLYGTAIQQLDKLHKQQHNTNVVCAPI